MATNFFILHDDEMQNLERDEEALLRIVDFLELKQFNVGETVLTYREASYINNNILDDGRENKGKWRKFSLKELIYLSIIKDLRKLGLKDNKLVALKKAFFDDNNKIFSNLAIIKTFQKVRIDIMIDEDFNVWFSDPVHSYVLFRKKFKISVNLNLNEYVINIWGKISGERIEYRDMFDALAENVPENDQRELLKLIKEENYEEFYYKKKGGSDKKIQIVTGIKRAKIKQDHLLNLVKQKFTSVKTMKENQKGEEISVEIKKTHRI